MDTTSSGAPWRTVQARLTEEETRALVRHLLHVTRPPRTAQGRALEEALALGEEQAALLRRAAHALLVALEGAAQPPGWVQLDELGWPYPPQRLWLADWERQTEWWPSGGSSMREIWRGWQQETGR